MPYTSQTLINPEQGTLSANKRILHALGCAADESNRYAMGGLRLTPAGEIVATDGKAMFYAKHREPFRLLEEAVTLESKALRAAYKGCKVSEQVGLLCRKALEGHYPDFAYVLPDVGDTRAFAPLGITTTKALRDFLTGLSHVGEFWTFHPNGRDCRIESSEGDFRLSGTTRHLWSPGEDLPAKRFNPSRIVQALDAFRAVTPDGKYPPAHTLDSYFPLAGGPLVFTYKSGDWQALSLVMPARWE